MLLSLYVLTAFLLIIWAPFSAGYNVGKKNRNVFWSNRCPNTRPVRLQTPITHGGDVQGNTNPDQEVPVTDASAASPTLDTRANSSDVPRLNQQEDGHANLLFRKLWVLPDVKQHRFRPRTKRSTRKFTTETNEQIPSMDGSFEYPSWQGMLQDWTTDPKWDENTLAKEYNPTNAFDFFNELTSLSDLKGNPFSDMFEKIKNKPVSDVDTPRAVDVWQREAMSPDTDGMDAATGPPQLDESVTGIQYIYDDISPAVKRVKFNAWGGKREYRKQTATYRDNIQPFTGRALSGTNGQTYPELIKLLRQLNPSDMLYLGKALGYIHSKDQLSKLRKKKTGFSSWGGKRNNAREKNHTHGDPSPEAQLILNILKEKLDEGEGRTAPSLEAGTFLKELKARIRRMLRAHQREQTDADAVETKRQSFNAWGGKRSML